MKRDILKECPPKMTLKKGEAFYLKQMKLDSAYNGLVIHCQNQGPNVVEAEVNGNTITITMRYNNVIGNA